MGSGLIRSDLATGFGLLLPDLTAVVIIFGPTPADRIFVVPGDARVFALPTEDRTFDVPAESRAFTA